MIRLDNTSEQSIINMLRENNALNGQQIKQIESLSKESGKSQIETAFELNITNENLQSRIRGSLLMAYSNNFSYLLISTGNKSEMSVGYSTIYGDMNGGFNVLKDIYKTDLYILANWRNQLTEKLFLNVHF